MNKQHIKGTHINACPLVLGTDYYGKTIPEETAYELMEAFCENGGNIIDTAHVYSDYLPGEKHMSEKVIGRWLLKSGRQKDLGKEIFIATKGGFPVVGDMHASRISYKEIKSDLEESLDCLQLGSVDLYWLHRDNKNIPAEEIVAWMDEFVKSGKIKSYGFSNWSAYRMQEALEVSHKNSYIPPVASQIRWSMASTEKEKREDDTLVEMDPEEYAFYKQKDISVFAFSSQAKGFFAKLRKDGQDYIIPEGKAGARYFNQKNITTYERLLPICAKYGVSKMQASLAWLTYAEFPVFPIIGCKTVEQLDDSMKALRLCKTGELKIEEFTNQMEGI